MAVLLLAGSLVKAQNKHDYVDLGLPSGTLWATCNVGATTPEACGDYFAWGETRPKTDTYQFEKGFRTFTKYCSVAYLGYDGYTDKLTVLQPEDDAATALWGSDWRMPTKAEWMELMQHTSQQWITRNGVNGHLFTASNGQSLFLPATGYMEDEVYFDGVNAGYWSSSLYTGQPSHAWLFFFIGEDHGSLRYDDRSDRQFKIYVNSRSDGHSVRPVRATR